MPLPATLISRCRLLFGALLLSLPVTILALLLTFTALQAGADADDLSAALPVARLTATARPRTAVVASLPAFTSTLYLPLAYTARVIGPPLPPPVVMSAPAPADFAAIRAELQANGRDLAFIKIGFHTGIYGNSDGLYEWMVQLDAAGVPFFLKSVDNAEPIYQAQQLKQNSGVPHVLVYRRSGDEYDVPNYHLTPAQAAQEHWQRHIAVFPPELDPDLVWLETVNEVDKERAGWLGQFALATAALALADGFRWAAFGWSSGEPEPHQWREPSMVQFLNLAAAHPEQLAIALHEYSYLPADIGHAYPYKLGRFQHLFQVADEYNMDRPTVLITEWGWAYQEIPEVADALADIAWASQLYAAYPQVHGAAIWFLGDGYGGIADQVQQLIAPMRDYSLSHYFIIKPGIGAIDTDLFPPPPPRN
jgi:hypothetical protein